MGGRKEEVDGVGSGGGEQGGGVVDTYVQHLVVPEFSGSLSGKARVGIKSRQGKSRVYPG